jgi:hypothetical protein
LARPQTPNKLQRILLCLWQRHRQGHDVLMIQQLGRRLITASPLADENAGPRKPRSASQRPDWGFLFFGTTTISVGLAKLATPVFVNRRGMARKPRLAPQRLAEASSFVRMGWYRFGMVRPRAFPLHRRKPRSTNAAGAFLFGTSGNATSFRRWSGVYRDLTEASVPRPGGRGFLL